MQRPPNIILKSMNVFASLNAGFKGLEYSKTLESLMRDVLGFLGPQLKKETLCAHVSLILKLMQLFHKKIFTKN